MQRGKVFNPSRAGQLRDFSGLRFGNITPTDLDAFIDFANRLFIFIEAKYKDTELPYGQRLALERLCDATDEEVPSFVLIISHDTLPDGVIDFASAKAVEYRYKGRWIEIDKEATCLDFVETIRQKYLS